MKKLIPVLIAALALSLCALPASVFANDAQPEGLDMLYGENSTLVVENTTGENTVTPSGDATGGEAAQSGKSHASVKTPMLGSSQKKNAIKMVVKKKTIKASSIKKKLSFKISAKAKDNAKLTYKLISVSPKKAAKYFTISKSGKVTVKKGLKPRAYKLKVQITAAKTAKYAQMTVKKSVTVKVKK